MLYPSGGQEINQVKPLFSKQCVFLSSYVIDGYRLSINSAGDLVCVSGMAADLLWVENNLLGFCPVALGRTQAKTLKGLLFESDLC